MDKSKVITDVKEVLAEITNMEKVIEMGLETSLREDLAMDSMTSLTFLMALEEKIEGFNVDPETLEVKHFVNIGSICDYVMMQTQLN